MRILSPRRSIKKVLTDFRGTSPRDSITSVSTASFSVDGFKKDDLSVSLSASMEGEPRVRFNMANTEYYEPQHSLDQSIWYSAEDSIKFRKECAKVARMLNAAEDSSDDATSFSRILLEAYQGFCEAETPDEVMKVFQANKVGLLDTALGLDSWIIRQIHYDRVERRRHLFSQIKSLQLNSFATGNPCTNKILKASRAHSRPSRLYAHHVALLIAEAVEEETTQ